MDGVAAALADIGLIIGQEGSLELSAFYYRLSLYLQPQLAEGISAMSFGNVLESNDRFEEAIGVYESVDPSAAYRKPALLRAAISLDRLDRPDEARAVFEEILDTGGGNDVLVLTAYGNQQRGRSPSPSVSQRGAERAPVREHRPRCRAAHARAPGAHTRRRAPA